MKNIASALKASLGTLLALSMLAGLAVAQNGQPNAGSANDQLEGRIVVYVWEAAAPLPESSSGAEDAKLSRNFSSAGLDAMTALRIWQGHLAYSIRNGYPLSEFWIAMDRERADEVLRQAALRTSNEADRMALRELVNQFENLQQWSDSLLEAKRNLRLAEYYITPATLNNDPLFQKASACSESLVAMLASGQLKQDASCR